MDYWIWSEMTKTLPLLLIRTESFVKFIQIAFYVYNSEKFSCFNLKRNEEVVWKIPMFDVVTRLHVYSFYFVSVIKHKKIHTETFYHENKTHVLKYITFKLKLNNTTIYKNYISAVIPQCPPSNSIVSINCLILNCSW